jgi:uncharacterized cupredoxin-like copper-binding protein
MTKSYPPYVGLAVVAVIFLALWIGAISVLVFHLQPPLMSTRSAQDKTPTMSLTLYEGEIADGKMGFGTAPNNLTSPGPTLRFKTSDVVSLTIINAGKFPHAFAVTDNPKSGANVLFNAEAGSLTKPLSPGDQATIVFTPNLAGSTFYYICPIPGHAEMGMWGSVIVTS